MNGMWWPRLLLVAVAASTAAACELSPGVAAVAKSPGDNFYRLVVNGEIERYLPGQRYVVTLVGSRTHDVVQQFTRFQLTLEPLDPATPRTISKQGQFQLFADTLTKFDDECTNSVIEADDLPKTEVQVMWKAPSSGSGCVLLKAMVYENATRWFAEDGQLTRRVCEDTSQNAPDCCACDDAKYKMVFEGIWSPETHPKDFPLETRWLTHFSDVIGATHPKNFTFWKEGQIATDGFRSLAEWGSVGLQERELRQRGNLLRSIVKAQGLWYPKVNSNTSSTFFVDKRRHLLSLASMFGPSPDWVVGVSGLDLCRKDCSWVESQVVDLYPYDAGTDNGISYMSPNAETVPREKIYRITTMYPEDPRAPFYNPGAKEIPPLARLHLIREKLISKSCDEETLLSFIAEETDDAEAVDRPECGVTEWSAWSQCSVSCGKGLRMRTREYRMPQKAQMFSCERQLVSKEMCVAAVPECEGEAASEETEPLEEGEGVCRVGEWGPWSECSVTCGAGVETRRRSFLDHMGYKKCPLVAVREERKCTEASCERQEPEVADPRCPTSEWAEWSPCSATCGRGVRFRTRLLLVAPEEQRSCSARVELVQQRACVERQDCSVDMLTAKRMCMEEAQAGPCRGVFRRWHFDASRGVCAPFSYGGCRGSRNNFLSAEDCVSTCSVMLGGTPPGVVQEQSDPVGGDKAEAAGPTLANPNDCKLGPWSEWSKCSVLCGTGYQERTRPILAEGGPGGVPCPTRLTRRRKCSRRC